MGWDRPLGGGRKPMGEEARDKWTENKQYCRVPGVEPVRLLRTLLGGGRGGVRWRRHIFSH